MGKRVLGLVCCSMGTGMLIVLVVPGWGFLVAMLLVILGSWLLCSGC